MSENTPILQVKNLTHIYSAGTPFEHKALDNVNLTVERGEFVALIGHTGSGKSTLIQHLNGLLRPTRGTVLFDGRDIFESKSRLRTVRFHVGLLFQYPEYQLFDQTVLADVSFGPKNLGLEENEVLRRAKEAIETVGLDYEEIKDRSPFDLSGGQKRRVAIAGVLAMDPKVLVLDEPTAGLDPAGRDEMYRLIANIREKTPTIIMISHNMDEISRHADRILVMDGGRLAYDQTPDELFESVEKMKKVGLDAPMTVRLKDRLSEKGVKLSGSVVKPEDFVRAVMAEVKHE